MHTAFCRGAAALPYSWQLWNRLSVTELPCKADSDCPENYSLTEVNQATPGERPVGPENTSTWNRLRVKSRSQAPVLNSTELVLVCEAYIWPFTLFLHSHWSPSGEKYDTSDLVNWQKKATQKQTSQQHVVQ